MLVSGLVSCLCFARLRIEDDRQGGRKRWWGGGWCGSVEPIHFTDNDINMEYYRIYGPEMVKLTDTIPLPTNTYI